MSEALSIRPAYGSDANEICEIYNHYVTHSIATFQLSLSTSEEFKEKILKGRYPFLVLEVDGKVQGYAYADQWNPREAYSKTATVSIYLDHKHTSKGWGKNLYQQLIEILRDQSYRCLIGVITLPNEKSQALHESLGFKKVGVFNEVGYKFDRWLDVGYWQLLLH